MTTGPAYTILAVDALIDGRRRVLVRKRGGRLCRLTVAARAANGPTIDAMITQVLSTWPPLPKANYSEVHDG